MYGIKVALGLGLLLATTYARPEGYGVKGGRNHKSGASATAIAQAAANANGGCPGIARSSATATASASANAEASGGTSNAAASANAFANAGNIGKAISCDDANRNANSAGDSDDLRLSSDHAKGTEKQSNKQENGTPDGGHGVADGGSDGNTGSVKVTEQNQDRRSGCDVPEGVKGRRGGCTNKDIGKENKPSVSNPYPTHRENPDLSGGSKYPTSLDGGYGGNTGNSGARPCTSGASGCSANKPSVANPYPTYQENPDLSGGSKYPISLDGGYGGNTGNSGSRPCTSGASGCSPNKPSVANPYPTYQENPDLSGGSKYPMSLDGGYGGNTGNSGSRPCTSGASGCSPNKPSVANPYPTYQKNPDLSGGSKYPMSLDGGYGGNTGNSGSRPCTSGASGCSPNKPSVANPYPTYQKNPDLSGGSKYPMSLDGGYGGNTGNSGSRPCASGASGCSPNKPSVANPHPTHHENPDLSGGSKHPTSLDDGYGGNTGNSGSRPCTSGASGCSPNKPSVSNPYPTHHKNPDLSGGSKHPTSLDGGYGGNTGNSGSRPCTSGASGCSPNKPSVANPYPTYQENPDLSSGSKYPMSLDGGYGGNTGNSGSRPCASGTAGCSGTKPSVSNPHASYPGNADSSSSSQHTVDNNYGKVEGNAEKPGYIPCHPGDPRCARNKPKPTTASPATTGIIESGTTPCASGAISCPKHKPIVAHPYPTYQENPDLSGGSRYPTNHDGGYGSKAPTSEKNPTSGASGNYGSSGKPNTSNPFLNGEIDVSNIKHTGNNGESSKYPDIKTNPSNPFLNPHSQVRPSTDTKHPAIPNGSYEGSTDSKLPAIKPNPSNPFLPHHGNADSTSGIKYPGVNSGFPQNTNLPNAGSHSSTNSDCHGSTACTPNKSTGHPENQDVKPNPSNPFLPHHGNADSTSGIKYPGVNSGFPQNTNLPNTGSHSSTNGDCHGSTACTPNKSTGHPENQDVKPNPTNPFLPQNGAGDRSTGKKYPELKPPILTNPGSFGESSYDLIDPHSNDKKNSGDRSTDKKYPELKPPILTNPGSFGESSYDRIDPHSNDKKNSGDSSTDKKYPELKPPILTNPGSFGESSYDRIDPHSNDKKNSGWQDGSGASPGTETSDSNPSFDRKPEVVRGCQGEISSTNCNQKDLGNNDLGVKTHQPGVKGGSRHHGSPTNLQGPSGLGKTDFAADNKGSAYSAAHATASASASAHSSAHASSSSSSGGGHSSAKSEAYSDAGGSGSSNAWSSSSASSSASAFASSSSYQGSAHWEQPHIPQVPAQ